MDDISASITGPDLWYQMQRRRLQKVQHPLLPSFGAAAAGSRQQAAGSIISTKRRGSSASLAPSLPRPLPRHSRAAHQRRCCSAKVTRRRSVAESQHRSIAASQRRPAIAHPHKLPHSPASGSFGLKVEAERHTHTHTHAHHSRTSIPRAYKKLFLTSSLATEHISATQTQTQS